MIYKAPPIQHVQLVHQAHTSPTFVETGSTGFYNLAEISSMLPGATTTHASSYMAGSSSLHHDSTESSQHGLHYDSTYHYWPGIEPAGYSSSTYVDVPVQVPQHAAQDVPFVATELPLPYATPGSPLPQNEGPQDVFRHSSQTLNYLKRPHDFIPLETGPFKKYVRALTSLRTS